MTTIMCIVMKNHGRSCLITSGDGFFASLVAMAPFSLTLVTTKFMKVTETINLEGKKMVVFP